MTYFPFTQPTSAREKKTPLLPVGVLPYEP